MRVVRVVREIEKFINKILGSKYVLEIDIVIDDLFRCISITNTSTEDISEEDIRLFLAMLYVEFGTYVDEIIDVLTGKMFNIYIHDDQYIRSKKIKNIMSRENI